MSLNTKTAAPAQTLRAAGLRATPQRVAILKSLEHDVTHPTAQDIFERLQRNFPSMSFATVYNTLSALTQAGRVRPMHVGGVTRFDPNVDRHHHAICDLCGAVRDVSIEAREEAAPRMVADGFEVTRVERTFRGRCARCRRARIARK